MKKKEDGSWFNLIPLNCETDSDHHLDTNNIKDPEFPILFLLSDLKKNHACLGRGLCCPNFSCYYYYDYGNMHITFLS